MKNPKDTSGASAPASGSEVVVIGAGYAGLFAARRVARAVGRGASRVTLVDPAPVWVERTRLHQVATGGDVSTLALGDLYDPDQVTTVAGRVTSIDPGRRLLTVEPSRADQQDLQLSYDRLVYAVGSTSDTAVVPGAADHAHVLDSDSTARDLERRLDVVAARAGGRVAVVGGGLTGVEAAAEIAETYPRLGVSLVSSGEIGAGISAKGRRHLRRTLDDLAVDLQTNATVASVDAGGLATADGRRIEADVVVWAAGLAVPDLARRAGFATDDRGRIVVDETLRSTSHPEVMAAGDGAWPVERVGAPVRSSAYVSTIMGAQAGTNLARELAGKPMRPLRFGYLLQAISLGRRNGLVQFTDGSDRPTRWVATGRAAAIIKEFVERVMVVGLLRLERRVPGAFAWRPAPRG